MTFFVHDRQLGRTQRVSVSSFGSQANAGAQNPTISSDGRFVTFNSGASNLVTNDTNVCGVKFYLYDCVDVFVHDRTTRKTTRVSVSSSGSQGIDSSSGRISGDGRYVAFTSFTSNFFAGDTLRSGDVFVHDRTEGTTTLVSVSSSGSPGDGLSWNSAISEDASLVAFESMASNLVPGDTNGGWDIYVHDLASGPCRDLNDNDQDGLLNGWELCGFDHNGDGDYDDPTDIPLPELGADPEIRDIFVEIDYMVDPGYCISNVCFFGHSHQPREETISRVVDAFFDQGIQLHVDYGSDAPLTYGDDQSWSDFSQAERLEHQTALHQNHQSWDDPDDWPAFDEIKNEQRHFNPERNRIFHYALFVHNLGGTIDGDPAGGTSGISRNRVDSYENFRLGASDFVVSLGGSLTRAGTRQQQAGTFMHELGHNLGLLHGGNDDDNFKPNYLSLMNYAFQFPGLIIEGEDGHLDYSRFGNAIIPPLVETNLNEGTGLNGGASIADFGTRYYCRPLSIWIERRETNANSAVDWNCNGIALGAVEANINDGNRDEEDTTLSTLFAYDDWSNIEFCGGLTGRSGCSADSLALPLSIQEEIGLQLKELKLEDAEKQYIPYSVAIEPSTELVVSPGISKNVAITLTNSGALTATVKVEMSQDGNWFEPAPTTVFLLEPGGVRIIAVGLNIPATAKTGQEQNLIVGAALSVSESPLMSDSAKLTAIIGPLAWFEAAPVSGIVPHSVKFRDISVGNISSWSWNFGDGRTSNKQNPTHIYGQPGIYSVILTVTGPDGSNKQTRSSLINVGYKTTYLPSLSK